MSSRRFVPVAGTALAILLLAGAGGVAYAGSHGRICGGSHGEVCRTGEILWSYPIQATPSPTCTVAIDAHSDTLEEVASNLAPGQSCTFSAAL